MAHPRYRNGLSPVHVDAALDALDSWCGWHYQDGLERGLLDQQQKIDGWLIADHDPADQVPVQTRWQRREVYSTVSLRDSEVLHLARGAGPKPRVLVQGYGTDRRDNPVRIYVVDLQLMMLCWADLKKQTRVNTQEAGVLFTTIDVADLARHHCLYL